MGNNGFRVLHRDVAEKVSIIEPPPLVSGNKAKPPKPKTETPHKKSEQIGTCQIVVNQKTGKICGKPTYSNIGDRPNICRDHLKRRARSTYRQQAFRLINRAREAGTYDYAWESIEKSREDEDIKKSRVWYTFEGQAQVDPNGVGGADEYEGLRDDRGRQLVEDVNQKIRQSSDGSSPKRTDTGVKLVPHRGSSYEGVIHTKYGWSWRTLLDQQQTNCPICGTPFWRKHSRQDYDKPECAEIAKRQKATIRKQRQRLRSLIRREPQRVIPLILSRLTYNFPLCHA